MDALKRIWASRKSWQVGIAGLAAGLPQVIALYLVLSGKIAPGQQAQVIQDVSNVLSLIAAALGGILAALTAAEDMARKYGVTSPPPGEPAVPPLSDQLRGGGR